MNNYTITHGSFTAQGNFTGYTAIGERILIYARQMNSLGWEMNEDVKYPFYTIAEEKDNEPLGTNGKPTGEKTKRLTALSVFKSNIDIKETNTKVPLNKFIQEQAEKVGISQEVLEILSQAKI